ncbi:hypothetical protein JCM16303_000087 [Sporobolomyces ruberrimus]
MLHSSRPRSSADSRSTGLQIDRLSLLPPELLSAIFDIAHDPEHPLVDGLSRTLYPYVRRNLYRQIRLQNPASLQTLLVTLSRNPHLVSLVVDFDAPGDSRNGSLVDPVLFDEFLTLQASEPSASNPGNSPLTRLPFLRSLSYDSIVLSSDHFLRLARLRSLTRLKIGFDVFEQNRFFWFPWSSRLRLEELHLVGFQYSDEAEERWSSDFAKVVDQCLSLTRLVLEDQVLPNYRSFLSALTLSKSTLTSLSLLSEPLDDNHQIACDDILPHFMNLEKLDLEDGTVTDKLPTHLRKLAKLASLRFGVDTHYDGANFGEIVDLVWGPRRIKTLQNLVLDTFEGKIGERFNASAGNSWRAVGEGGLELSKTGWSDEGYPDWTGEGLLELVELGRENGVCVTGSAMGMIKVWEAFDLELANRIVLQAHETKSLDEYVEMRSSGLIKRLPELNVDKLKTKQFKLVKIDLPEEGWFQLTFE